MSGRGEEEARGEEYGRNIGPHLNCSQAHRSNAMGLSSQDTRATNAREHLYTSGSCKREWMKDRTHKGKNTQVHTHRRAHTQSHTHTTHTHMRRAQSRPPCQRTLVLAWRRR